MSFGSFVFRFIIVHVPSSNHGGGYILETKYTKLESIGTQFSTMMCVV